MRPRVILLEFNELCPELLDRFIAQGKLPAFKRLRGESHVYLTDAGEQAPNLEPWIQWVTVHCGLPFQEHGVFHLGDGPALAAECIWDVLSKANLRVAVCGSMNVRYDRPINGYVLPDPWTVGAEPYPASLAPYMKFVQTNVQEHTNERVPLSHSDYLKFLGFMARHGLSFETGAGILRQLRSERDGRNRWKRAIILDKLQFDVFRHFYRKASPDFSTFFLNSTAHLQHTYWRNMEPELFSVKPSEQEQAEFAEAILFGYQHMDRLIAQFMELAGPDVTIIFATGLSQQPCLIYEEKGGKVLYRPRDFEKLLSFAGVSAPHTIAPVMAEQFYIYFENERDAAAAQTQLAALGVDGHPALILSRDGASIFAGCGLFTDQRADSVLHIADSDRTVTFFDLFYKIEGMKSGMHHPDGILWVRSPQHKYQLHSGKVPLTAIAPTILRMYGIAPPAQMRGEILEEVLSPDMALHAEA